MPTHHANPYQAGGRMILEPDPEDVNVLRVRYEPPPSKSFLERLSSCFSAPPEGDPNCFMCDLESPSRIMSINTLAGWAQAIAHAVAYERYLCPRHYDESERLFQRELQLAKTKYWAAKEAMGQPWQGPLPERGQDAALAAGKDLAFQQALSDYQRALEEAEERAFGACSVGCCFVGSVMALGTGLPFGVVGGTAMGVPGGPVGGGVGFVTGVTSGGVWGAVATKRTYDPHKPLKENFQAAGKETVDMGKRGGQRVVSFFRTAGKWCCDKCRRKVQPPARVAAPAQGAAARPMKTVIVNGVIKRVPA